ncbi:MAG: NAD-dependent epimerase/dehydratase family protein [Candidatus Margulisiibacteriota bacterium]
MKTLVTGSAGFIGFHVSAALLAQGDEVVGLDDLNDYYDVGLKLARNAILQNKSGYNFYRLDLCDYEGLTKLFRTEKIDRICHLAAQPGVRYSLTNPFAYQKSNNEGFLNIIEGARQFGIKQFVFASSSSVYGGNTKLPFSVDDRVDNPISLYAATKRSNELVAHVYSHLYGIQVIGLRFFTVYGPWGRPDMAYFSFTKAILDGQPIDVYNQGKMTRNFTYIDDIVAGVKASLVYNAKYEIFNLGNDKTVELLSFISCLEKLLGKKAKLTMMPLQPGDPIETWADISSAKKKLNYRPKTDIEAGLKEFVAWFQTEYAKEKQHV